MLRYALWALLGAAALGSLFLPSAPDAKAEAPVVAQQELPATLSLTLSQ